MAELPLEQRVTNGRLAWAANDRIVEELSEDVIFAGFERYKATSETTAAAESGALTPPWPLIISYEHAIRKYTYKLMAKDGRPFGVTLAKACKDATVKECNFTTPLALHAKRPHPNPPLIRFKGDKGKGRGRGRGGKLLTKTTNTANRTP